MVFDVYNASVHISKIGDWLVKPGRENAISHKIRVVFRSRNMDMKTTFSQRQKKPPVAQFTATFNFQLIVLVHNTHAIMREAFTTS